MRYNPYQPLRRPNGQYRPTDGGIGLPPPSPPPLPEPPPEPPPRDRRGVALVAVGCAVVFVVLCVVIATNLAGRHKATAAQPDAGPTATGQSPPSVALPVPETDGPVVAPVHPKTVLSVDGRGSVKTQQFTTGADWYLRYSYQCSEVPDGARLQVFEYSATEQGTLIVDETDQDGTDTLPQHGTPGTRYLRITSNCSWTVTILG
jgi:hypothetical protein